MLGYTLGFVAIPETVALIFGRKFGKHNFSYFISPKKTWEGLFGQFFGIFGAMLIIESFLWIFSIPRTGISTTQLITIGLVIIGVSVLGDLMESVIKRAVMVKDSSATGIVGKLGGILDKFDSFGVSWIAMFIMIKVYCPDNLPY